MGKRRNKSVIIVLSITFALSLLLFVFGVFLLIKTKSENKNSNTKTFIVSEEVDTNGQSSNKEEQTAELKEESDKIKKNKENIVVVKTTPLDLSNIVERSVHLDVKYLPQNPELPTGCEITSLTTVLNYFGYSVTKLEMSNNYLEKSEAPSDWTKVFVGNPTRSDSFGCYAQPITDAANKYFADNGNKHIASNMSGADFAVILEELQYGYPVILWGTSGLSEAYKTISWTVDGEEMQWIAPEHCYVMIGYDIDKNIVIISDPQKGITEYDLSTVRDRYEALERQCVFIEESPYYSSEEINEN